jgi:hypothetical protein
VRLVTPPDVGDLIRLASRDNPFLRQDQVLDREVLADRIGLLVGSGPAGATLLYVWTQPVEEMSSWMAHAAQWLDRYPIWQKAHGLHPSVAPVRVVLASPDVGERARSALRLVSCHVTLARYVYVEIGGQAALGWDLGPEPGKKASEEPTTANQHVGEREKASITEDLTMEELAFFRTV